MDTAELERLAGGLGYRSNDDSRSTGRQMRRALAPEGQWQPACAPGQHRRPQQSIWPPTPVRAVVRSQARAPA